MICIKPDAGAMSASPALFYLGPSGAGFSVVCLCTLHIHYHPPLFLVAPLSQRLETIKNSAEKSDRDKPWKAWHTKVNATGQRLRDGANNLTKTPESSAPSSCCSMPANLLDCPTSAAPGTYSGIERQGTQKTQPRCQAHQWCGSENFSHHHCRHYHPSPPGIWRVKVLGAQPLTLTGTW
ncbi:hypothetical protein LX32DRAFT_211640 [Colletotrichum zoysiae]|uniref:Uncharacterized protein n=1 Tax=Colletotrichum zoysiae TaxID=1216348 RepID=A0AAD9H4F0_9PEZI|nr:hypothetical protein LX32DRAFT_211640 [Colletotrichum zoysiae]